MENITYLLGAGASAKALPLIKKSNDSKNGGLPDELKSFIESHTSSFLNFNKEWSSNEIDRIKNIVDKCVEFGTPDLYAKFLLETGNANEYRILKTLLSVYFKYKQELKDSFDYRALTFLTTISNDKKIPGNVKVLSWNYDSQLEIAAKKLKPLNPSGYPCIQGFSSWPNIDDGFGIESLTFLLHINGIAGFNYSQREFYERITNHFNFSTTLSKELMLSFAWEDENNASMKIFFEQRLKFANAIAKDTNILVIIGYSFPFFNRLIDKMLFSSMNGSLRKIYIQDPNNIGNIVKEQFDLIDSVKNNIVNIQQTENYHIPFEL